MRKQVLVIDSDLDFCREIKRVMEDETTYIHCTESSEQALWAYMQSPYCLVIMDSLFAKANDFALLKAMRSVRAAPILVRSSEMDKTERVSLLRAGASALLEKHCDMEECLALAQSLMQLYLCVDTDRGRCYALAFGTELVVDPMYRQVTLHGDPLELTRREFDLLYYLARHRGQVFSREQIYSSVWHSDADYNVDETVKACIKALRKKLAPAKREYIENVRGVGYRFVG